MHLSPPPTSCQWREDLAKKIFTIKPDRMLYSRKTIPLLSRLTVVKANSSNLVIGFISLKLSILLMLFFKIAKAFKLHQMTSESFKLQMLLSWQLSGLFDL